MDLQESQTSQYSINQDAVSGSIIKLNWRKTMERYFHFDRSLPLEKLENTNWSLPDYNSSLSIKCFELGKIPVGNLTVEGLRLLIRQELGLDYLIPLALETLENNTLSQGDLYCGDLLESVLKVNKSFWVRNQEYRNDLESIMENAISEMRDKLDEFRNSLLNLKVIYNEHLNKSYIKN